MQHGGRFIGEDLFGFVDFCATEIFETAYFVHRQFGEETQEAADIGIFRIAPILPVIIDGQHVGV